MTRNECEDKLIVLAEQAEAVFKAYSPEGGRLSLTACDGHISIMGWKGDIDEMKPWEDRYIVYCTKFVDGAVWHKDVWDASMGEGKA